MQDEDYLDEIVPGESQGARTITAPDRRAAYEYRTLSGDIGGAIPSDFGPADEELYRLQVVVLKRLKDRAHQPLIRGVLSSRAINSDVYATFYHGFRRRVIDPNLVLMEASRVACAPKAMWQDEEDKSTYIQLVALALRFGADPNQYIDSGRPELTHVIYWVHRLSEPDRETYDYESVDAEEYVKTRIIALLILAGGNPNLPCFAADTRRTTMTGMLMKNPDAEASVLKTIELDLENPQGSSLETVQDSIQDRLLRMNEVLALKQHPQDLPNEYPDEWTPEATLELLYMFDWAPVGQELPVEGMPGEISSITEVHAHSVLAKSLSRMDPRVVKEGGEGFLDLACRHLDVTSVDLLLANGAVPTYQLADELLLRISRVKAPLPLTADIICHELALFTRYGYPLDDAQMNNLGRNLPSCVGKMRKLTASMPRWRSECTIRGGEASTDLKETARGAGIDPSIGKLRICSGLTTLAAQDPALLERIARTRQTDRLRTLPGTFMERVEDELAMKATHKRRPLLPPIIPVPTPIMPTTTMPLGTPLILPPKPVVYTQQHRPVTRIIRTTTQHGTPHGIPPTFLPTTNPVEDNDSNLQLDDEQEVTTTKKKGEKQQVSVKSDYVRGKCDGDVCTFEAGSDVVDTSSDISNNGSGRTETKQMRKDRKSGSRHARQAINPVFVPSTITTEEVIDEPIVVIEEPSVVPPITPPITPIPTPIIPLTRVNESRMAPTRIAATRNPVTRGVLAPATLKSGIDTRNRALSTGSPQNSGRVCTNESGLRYPASTYSDIDIVVYNDSKGYTWCFTSEDYAGLLEQKKSPETGEALPGSVMDEMRAKLSTLKAQGTTSTPTDIGSGLRRLRTGGYSSENISIQRVQRLKDYYVLAGLDPKLFTEQYGVGDMQNILDALYSPSPTLDVTNRNHAMISYASSIVRDIDEAPDSVERQQEVFEYISSYSGTTEEPLPEAEEEEQGGEEE